MENPFKILDARLRNIENILLDIRYPTNTESTGRNIVSSVSTDPKNMEGIGNGK